MSDNYFVELNRIDCSDKVEKKNDLSYLSWAWAWAEFKKMHPDAVYEVVKFDGLPYVHDPATGYMVYTNVTVNGITHEMWLPVMDSNNYAMKSEPYEVQTKYKKVTVKPATMFDINKSIMRCLTKNLAMHGLGLYIYAGEDLPEDAEPKQELTPFKPDAPIKPDVPEEVVRASKIKYNGISLGKIFKNDKALFAELITSGDEEIMRACEIISAYMQERN